ERGFFASGCRAQPAITRSYYESRTLSFDPVRKTEEFLALEQDIRRQLGGTDTPGRIMMRMSREYRDVVHMLTLRGTPAFSRWAVKLYGSSVHMRKSEGGFRSGPGLRIWPHVSAVPTTAVEKTLNAQETVQTLMGRLGAYFKDAVRVRVRLSDGIISD